VKGWRVEKLESWKVTRLKSCKVGRLRKDWKIADWKIRKLGELSWGEKVE
jgi:hypothetical protein